MAKAQFHKNQRVYVKPVGTWALIEAVVPQWAKGVEEPIKITYEVGLGRPFGFEELQSEEVAVSSELNDGVEWRLIRGQNKWKSADECSHHPYPGTYPVIVTSEENWGGWRVPGAEYDRNPADVEWQARVIAHSLMCVKLLRSIVDFAEESPENLPNQMVGIAQDARGVLKAVER